MRKAPELLHSNSNHNPKASFLNKALQWDILSGSCSTFWWHLSLPVHLTWNTKYVGNGECYNLRELKYDRASIINSSVCWILFYAIHRSRSCDASASHTMTSGKLLLGLGASAVCRRLSSSNCCTILAGYKLQMCTQPTPEYGVTSIAV